MATRILNGRRVPVSTEEMADIDASRVSIPKTLEETQAEVERLADQFTNGDDRDKALAMVLADIVKLVVPALSEAQARNQVRQRFVTYLREIRGI